jgi:hypothetical protein
MVFGRGSEPIAVLARMRASWHQMPGHGLLPGPLPSSLPREHMINTDAIAR